MTAGRRLHSGFAKGYMLAFTVARKGYPGFARQFALVCLIVAGVALLNSAIPYLLRLAIDAIGPGSKGNAPRLALSFAFAYGVCWSTAASMEWLRNAAAASMQARCEASFRQAFHASFLRAQYAEVLRIDPGTLLSRFNRCATAFGSLTYTLFWALLPTAIQWMLACAVLARVIDPRYALAFGALMLAVFAGTVVLSRRTQGANTIVAQAADRLGSNFTERVGFVFDVKMNAAQALLAGASLTVLTVAAAALPPETA